MPYSEELAKAVVHNLQAQLRANKFFDITVTIQETPFRCHRLILCACSKYFNDRLQNPDSNELVLKNVKEDTFRQILECIYGGENILTEENASELWRAAYYLEIDFLYKACEKYKLDQLTNENCVEINNLAKSLGSKKVQKAAWNKLVGSFQDVYARADFVKLDFDDMMAIVCYEDLTVSCEDAVVMAVLKWVSHTPEAADIEDGDGYRYASENGEDVPERVTNPPPTQDRKAFVMELLSSCRLFLASGSCIQKLLDTNWVIKNKKAFSLVREALRYHLHPERRGFYCPPQAVNRSKSEMLNCILSIYRHSNGSQILACRAPWGAWYRLGGQSSPSGECIASHGTDLYILYSAPRKSTKGLSLQKYNTVNGEWLEMPALASASGQFALICHDHYVYAFDGACLGTVFRYNILEGGVGEWEKVCKLKATVRNAALTFAAGLATFQTASHTYLLLSTGEVWRLVSFDWQEVKLVHKGKLFEEELPLLSAVTFKDELFLSLSQVNGQVSREWDAHCIDLVSHVKIVERPASCLLNAVIPEMRLKKEENY
ncbi:Kelch-like protein 40 [Bulinus truncatus]|nr:Kelch-like protein 40 [Bulinus truncatus]